MSLPTHGTDDVRQGEHLVRHGLVDALQGSPLVVIHGASGMGKSVLAGQLAQASDLDSLAIDLEYEATVGASLADALAAAAVRLHRRDLAASLRSGADLVSVLDQVAPVLLLIDGVERLAEADLVPLRMLAGRARDDLRVIIVGRHLDHLEPLPPMAVVVGSEQLRFNASDLADLAERSGRNRDGVSTEEILRRTEGWPAAVRMVLDGPEDQPLSATPGGDVIAQLVARILATADPDQRRAARGAASLPRLDEDVVDAACGPKAWLRLREIGLPLHQVHPPWWELSTPVVEALGRHGRLDVDEARRAVERYQARGDARTALIVAERHDPALVMEVLALLGDADLEAFTAQELFLTLNAIPPAARLASPRGVITVSRLAQFERATDLQLDALQLCADLVDLDDAVSATWALYHVMHGSFDQVERARDVVARDQDDMAVAIACEAISREATYHYDHDEARRWAQRAAVRWERAGRPRQAAYARFQQAWLGEYVGMQFEPALDRMQQALIDLDHAPLLRRYLLPFVVVVQLEMGRLDDARNTLGEVARLNELTGGDRRFESWLRARLASQCGDRDTTVRLVSSLLDGSGTGLDRADGAMFRADAALLLDRVGEREFGERVLAEARAAGAGTSPWLLMAELAMAARDGDLARALELGRALEDHEGFGEGERPRLDLYTAAAAARAGAPEAGELTRRAVAWEHRLGLPEMLRHYDAELATEVHRAAGGAEHVHMSVRVLGGLSVTLTDGTVAAPQGRQAELLATIVLAGGAIPAERAVDQLWPDAGGNDGRTRLRTVLKRLREQVGDLVIRDGPTLRLRADTDVDLFRYDDLAGQALARDDASAVLLARRAVAEQDGELLPDLAHLDWIAERRRHLLDRQLALLDLLARTAEDAGRLDDALKWLHLAQTVAPEDETFLARAARLLLVQGRRGRALHLLDRAEAVLADLGLAPGETIASLRREAGDT